MLRVKKIDEIKVDGMVEVSGILTRPAGSMGCYHGTVTDETGSLNTYTEKDYLCGNAFDKIRGSPYVSPMKLHGTLFLGRQERISLFVIFAYPLEEEEMSYELKNIYREEKEKSDKYLSDHGPAGFI